MNNANATDRTPTLAEMAIILANGLRLDGIASITLADLVATRDFNEAQHMVGRLYGATERKLLTGWINDALAA